MGKKDSKWQSTIHGIVTAVLTAAVIALGKEAIALRDQVRDASAAVKRFEQVSTHVETLRENVAELKGILAEVSRR